MLRLFEWSCRFGIQGGGFREALPMEASFPTLKRHTGIRLDPPCAVEGSGRG